MVRWAPVTDAKFGHISVRGSPAAATAANS